MKNKPSIRLLVAAILLAVTACGGGGSDGNASSGGFTGGGSGNDDATFNADTELRRLSAISQYTFDLLSIFYPMSQQYLEDRAAMGAIACPNGGTLNVTEPTIGNYVASFASCNVGWTVLEGTVRTRQTTRGDTNYVLNLAWNDISIGGEFRGEYTEETPPRRMDIEGAEDITVSVAGQSLVTGFGPGIRQQVGQDFFVIEGINDISDPVNGGTINFSDGTNPPATPIVALDGSGTFFRIEPPTAGELDYARANTGFFFAADILVSGNDLTVEFTRADGSPLATRQLTGAQLFALAPIYAPNH